MPFQIITNKGNRYCVTAFIDTLGVVHEAHDVKACTVLNPEAKKDVRTLDLQQKIHDIDNAVGAGDFELNEWETKFITSQVERSRQFGSKLEISPAQKEKIEEIWEKLQKERNES